MATTGDFGQALAQVLKYEGGYVNNPADPGGATNKGITQATYSQYLATQGRDDADVQGITDAEVSAIYYNQYWLTSGADQLSMPLALIHFDSAVNTGVGQAAKFLAQSGGDPAKYLDVRKAFYNNLAASRPELAQFLTGWLNRVNSLATSAVGLSGLAILALLVVGWWAFAQARGRA